MGRPRLFFFIRRHDRQVLGKTNYIETNVQTKSLEAKKQIGLWMDGYSKNLWENQKYYPEVFIEKKALQSVFTNVCRRYEVALCPCKGYPSLTYLNLAYERFKYAVMKGKSPIILYFGDYDPSGEDIPRNIQESLYRLGVDIEMRRIALMESQVNEMGLPPAPTKSGDSRAAKWEGLGQVELDAIEPNELKQMAENSILDLIDLDSQNYLRKLEEKETKTFRAELKKYVKSL